MTPRRHPKARHALRADDMRRHPHMWIEVAVYNGRQSADSAAYQIRTGGDRFPHYRPAGAFEARTEPVDGGTALYARYIGDTK